MPATRSGRSQSTLGEPKRVDLSVRQKRAVLVAVVLPGAQRDLDDPLDELRGLAKTAGVKIVGTFPAESHPPIIYPIAATISAKSRATDYLAFLRSPVAKTIFEKYGFTFLIRPTS